MSREAVVLSAMICASVCEIPLQVGPENQDESTMTILRPEKRSATGGGER